MNNSFDARKNSNGYKKKTTGPEHPMLYILVVFMFDHDCVVDHDTMTV